ncbi:MAG: hypothetical protein PHF97_01250 [Bacteroidales bacterium]|nr:hypothetical protein [Bacteroidales bacterium]
MLKKKKINTFLAIKCCIVIAMSMMFVLTGCHRETPHELYHTFEKQVWPRFDKVNFEIPIKTDNKSYDIVLFAYFTNDFPYEVLDVNMIMNTPSGEERINSFQMKVKNKAGTFVIPHEKDSYRGDILLKKELFFSKAGILHIELENLIPRMQAEGILGVGIRLIPLGK